MLLLNYNHAHYPCPQLITSRRIEEVHHNNSTLSTWPLTEAIVAVILSPVHIL